jgi:hypothetical protein
VVVGKSFRYQNVKFAKVKREMGSLGIKDSATRLIRIRDIMRRKILAMTTTI